MYPVDGLHRRLSHPTKGSTAWIS